MFRIDSIEARSWTVLRDLRLAALKESPEWFAGNYAEESKKDQQAWVELVEHDSWFALYDNESPIGVMAISSRDTGRGTDCWLYSCWISPEYRGQGLLRLMIEKLDEQSRAHGWKVQGLGVWPHNLIAIEAYQQMGFEKSGEPKPSRYRAGQLYQLMRRDFPHDQM
jgi:ribosomal protein S18 acetylase RimI-like enzyme